MKGKRKCIRVVKICRKCPSYHSDNGGECELFYRNVNYLIWVKVKNKKFKARPMPSKCPYKLEHVLFNTKENKKYYV